MHYYIFKFDGQLGYVLAKTITGPIMQTVIVETETWYFHDFGCT